MVALKILATMTQEKWVMQRGNEKNRGNESRYTTIWLAIHSNNNQQIDILVH